MDCSNDYQPICGTDGKTYDNSCTLQQAICRTQGFIQRAYKGACENKGSLFIISFYIYLCLFFDFFFF